MIFIKFYAFPPGLTSVAYTLNIFLNIRE